MPKMGVEPQVSKLLHKLKLRFMQCKDSQARQAFMVQTLGILESYLNAHEISTAYFLSALEEVEQWDWEEQLREIRNLPETTK
jgi:hypothetical protein